MRDRQEVIDISREDREQRKQQFNKSFGKVQAQVIPPNPDLLINISDRQEIVGPYCRVLTMSGEQVESFEMQRIYYKNLFAKRPNWTLHDIYADEGLSATSTKRRKDFQRLVYDCENHILTLVLAKSVTRFARNVVDCVSTCRRLKHLTPPVGVLFETENIHTLTQSSEVPLNMFALLAQSESETKSASVKWGIRNRFASNIPRVVAAYGYIKDGKTLQINPETASVVLYIYQTFVAGCSVYEITKILEGKYIPSPQGKPNWTPNTVFYILTNEKYMGDVMNQKTFVDDCFSHQSIKNIGQLPRYRFENIVPPIVPTSLWECAQYRLLERRWTEFLDMTQPPEIIGGIPLYPTKIGGNYFEHQLV